MNILFLDDDETRNKHVRSCIPSATIVTTAKECIELLNWKGLAWDLVSLDHDLGGEVYVDSGREDCGMEVARWVATHKPRVKLFVIHSFNVAAAIEMGHAIKGAGYTVIMKPFNKAFYQGLSIPTS